MNILLINHYAGSSGYGMEYRPYYLSREWVKAGHRVRIVAASESHVRQRSPELDGGVTFENIDGIEYAWIKTPAYQGNGIRRVWNILSFVKSLFTCQRILLSNFMPDVVVASSTYPLDVYPASGIAQKTGAQLVFEVHDLWPLSPIELGGISPRHPFMRVLQHAEDFACRNADKVISILPNTKQHLVEHGMRPDKFAHIPNGIVLEDWGRGKALPEDVQGRLDEFKQELDFLIAYAGAHGVANALDCFVGAAGVLHDQKIGFVLVGDGVQKPSLMERARKRKLHNVLFMDTLEKDMMPAFLSNMDGLFIGLKKQSLFRFGVSPNKMFDYMMAAKPVIYAIKAGNDIALESGCGISCEPENVNAVADAILSLKAMAVDRRREMGQRGREYVERHHDYRVLADQFIQVFEADSARGAANDE